ncbi:HAD family hydrolase [Rubellicoccus peritrichatus]|uniref:HAD family hydrolase n=1 Tax=Rubellicoccus peritrichatus TaxID=3080537 RepID=A0AAQ3L9S3_9BACT|nr:HAD family hydrolase [Puniceicoccus sp. CR14]WOO41292.1 HAD family hydrolase [Puniceicoccus sp. CR14]
MKRPSHVILTVSIFILVSVNTAWGFRLPEHVINPLASWNNTPAKLAILDYVQRATSPSDPGFVPIEERIAVFDMDGTILCEKPMYFQIVVSQERLREQAAADPSLALKQPWKSAVEHDDAYVFAGNYEEVTVTPFIGATQANYIDYSKQFLRNTIHPRFNRPYAALFYKPMIELMSLLAEKQFAVYVVSGSQTAFVRAVLDGRVNIEPERAIGSKMAMEFRLDHGRPVFVRSDHYWDPLNLDAGKPENIWEQIGRGPVFAAGNTMGDYEMLQFAGHGNRASFAMIVNHDDPIREYDYPNQELLGKAAANGWLVVSMRSDFRLIFE